MSTSIESGAPKQQPDESLLIWPADMYRNSSPQLNPVYVNALGSIVLEVRPDSEQ